MALETIGTVIINKTINSDKTVCTPNKEAFENRSAFVTEISVHNGATHYLCLAKNGESAMATIHQDDVTLFIPMVKKVIDGETFLVPGEVNKLQGVDLMVMLARLKTIGSEIFNANVIIFTSKNNAFPQFHEIDLLVQRDYATEAERMSANFMMEAFKKSF